jgi:glutamine synthetase
MTAAIDRPMDTSFLAHGNAQFEPACRLVRLIGKPADVWTVDDLVELVANLSVRLVSLMHVGGDSALKTLDFVPRDEHHLRQILQSGERADGSSVFSGKGISVGASDIVLKPRLSTAFLDPFATQPTLVLLADHLGRDRAPLPQSPTTIVRRAYERLQREAGLDLYALGEVEFFLGKHPEEADLYASADRGYHAASPFVFGEPLRRQALVLLSEIGVPVKYGHAEVGHINADEVDARMWEQHEIELALQPIHLAADSVLLTEWVLRNLAHKNGMRCSFEPILRKGHAGSGMHFHLSPVVNGVHLRTADTTGALAPVSQWLIAGLVTMAGALMAFGNRSANSFIRLNQAKEAPNTVTWGRFNRKALIRLPLVATDEAGQPVHAETVEFRLPDGSAHPHLVLAGIAQALLKGKIEADIQALLARTAAEDQGYPNGYSVPRSFGEVARALAEQRASLEAGDIFPAMLIDRTIEGIAAQK